MHTVSAEQIRLYIARQCTNKLAERGLSPNALPDDFNLYSEGVIDSIGLLEIIDGIEEAFGLQIDLQGMDPDQITLIGPLSRFIAGGTPQPPTMSA